MSRTTTAQELHDGDAARDHRTSALAPGGEPLAISVADACRISGMSRSELYRRLADRQIQAVKSGVRTLIVMDSLRRHIASLPPARFGKATDAG